MRTSEPRTHRPAGVCGVAGGDHTPQRHVLADVVVALTFIFGFGNVWTRREPPGGEAAADL
ncbi:MAG: hypothetical protein ACRDR6_08570 [Pseudonocardiaceae bacterium]